MAAAPSWSSVSTSVVENFFDATAAAVKTAKTQYDELILHASKGSSDAGTLAQKWVDAAAPGNSSNVAQLDLSEDMDATAFAYISCLKQQYTGKAANESIGTFVGLMAMSPLRKYDAFWDARFLPPTDQAFLDLVDYLGDSTSIPSGGPILPYVTPAQATALVAMHLIPDDDLQSALGTAGYLAIAGSYPGLIPGWYYDYEDVRPPFAINSTMDAGDTYAFATITASDGTCVYETTPSAFFLDKVLGCYGSVSACPLADGFGGVAYKPTVNVKDWTLPAAFAE